MTLQPRKACPRCQSAAPLTAAQCLACGHQYRTLFVTPQPAPITSPTRKIYALAVSTSDSKTVQVALSLCLALLAITALRFGMQVGIQTAPLHSRSFHRTDPVRRGVSLRVAGNKTPIDPAQSEEPVASAQPDGQR